MICCAAVVLSACAQPVSAPYVAQRAYLGTQVIETPSQIAVIPATQQTVLLDQAPHDIAPDSWQVLAPDPAETSKPPPSALLSALLPTAANATAMAAAPECTPVPTPDLVPSKSAGKTRKANHKSASAAHARQIRCEAEEKAHG